MTFHKRWHPRALYYRLMARLWLAQAERLRTRMIAERKPREHNAEKTIKTLTTECLKAENKKRGFL